MPEVSVSWSVLVPTVLATVAFFLLVVGKTIQAHRKRSMTGREGLVGSVGKVTGAFTPEGRVFVHGEIWRAVCPEGAAEVGASVRVKSVKGLLLTVEPLEQGKTD